MGKDREQENPETKNALPVDPCAQRLHREVLSARSRFEDIGMIEIRSEDFSVYLYRAGGIGVVSESNRESYIIFPVPYSGAYYLDYTDSEQNALPATRDQINEARLKLAMATSEDPPKAGATKKLEQTLEEIIDDGSVRDEVQLRGALASIYTIPYTKDTPSLKLSVLRGRIYNIVINRLNCDSSEIYFSHNNGNLYKCTGSCTDELNVQEIRDLTDLVVGVIENAR